MGHTDHFADSDSEFASLVEKARSGCEVSRNELLDRCRPYMLLIANQELDPALRAKVGASDIVQNSLLGAQRGLKDFRGSTEKELLGWLRGIVINDLRDSSRRYRGTKKRNLNVEQPIHGDSNAGWPSMSIRDGQLTPRADAMANEEMLMLRNALNKLPEDYREVIRLRNWQELPFADIGKQIGRSSEAARKLWSRAILQLQRILEQNHGDDTV